jgi:hypothetical protein
MAISSEKYWKFSRLQPRLTHPAHIREYLQLICGNRSPEIRRFFAAWTSINESVILLLQRYP